MCSIKVICPRGLISQTLNIRLFENGAFILALRWKLLSRFHSFINECFVLCVKRFSRSDPNCHLRHHGYHLRIDTSIVLTFNSFFSLYFCLPYLAISSQSVSVRNALNNSNCRCVHVYIYTTVCVRVVWVTLFGDLSATLMLKHEWDWALGNSEK